MTEETSAEPKVVRTLSRIQRRVLGVLLEKSFTTPDQYPMTLKAATSGCNQKSNRSPLTDYDEDDVMDALDELRELGLVTEVHTESGRTARYRHNARHHWTFSEPQLAILTELMLRGRQTIGELRGRANRMVPIDGLDTLRTEFRGLVETGFAEAGGRLEQRGVEVDHGFHGEKERRAPFAASAEPVESAEVERVAAPPPPVPSNTATPSDVEPLKDSVAKLEFENRSLAERIDTLELAFRTLEERFESLRRDLGG